jgi:hypothetical protein
MILKKIDNLITSYNFSKFCQKINSNSIEIHDEIINSAYALYENYNNSFANDNLIYKTGLKLRSDCLESFADKYKNSDNNVKILIHTPPKNISPGGFSLFTNLAESLNFIGVDCKTFSWNDTIEDIYTSFRPTHLFSSDSADYLQHLDWDFINKMRKDCDLLVGLTASIEAYGNTPLGPRLKWAHENIDFYYSFRCQEYLKTRIDYQPFYDNYFDILSVEFGANPLCYYPISLEKKYDYIFLASSNRDKQKRYLAYLPSIFQKYIGIIDGPGWDFNKSWSPKHIHRYLYGMSRIGINLHIDDSIDWASELNERTYILGACGIPQVIDNAKLLNMRYSVDSMFVADTPKQYLDTFEFALNNPIEAEKRALSCMIETFENHTTFHRAESLLSQLNNLKYA